MEEKTPLLPIVKWAGGKRQIADEIVKILSKYNYNAYFEPFLGGGAILFKIKPKKAVAFDLNPELIHMYNIVKDKPIELIQLLREEFVPNHSKDFYYKVRSLDREDNFSNLPPLYRAARLIYLNRTCYNGLWRVNKKGQNNVPIGRSSSTKILFEDRIIALHKYLSGNDIQFINDDYTNVVKYTKKGDLVYFDPPYHIEKGQSEFTNYTMHGFNEYNQRKLKQLCDRLVNKGVTVAVSNSKTEFILNLYNPKIYTTYTIHKNIISRRNIASNGKSRKKIDEVLIVGKNNYNY